jgi:hypothetical protein
MICLRYYPLLSPKQENRSVFAHRRILLNEYPQSSKLAKFPILSAGHILHQYVRLTERIDYEFD